MNNLQQLIDLGENLLVAKANKTKTKAIEYFFSFLIGLNLLDVNIAIYFYDESSARAVKVHNESVNRVLPVKLIPSQLASAQPLPQSIFCRRWFIAHLPGDRS
jgi:hypothetical protein